MTTAATPTGADEVVSSMSAERIGFADYVAQRRPALLRAARAISGDPGSAEDLLQTALASVWPRWTSIREPSAADAYVRRTMRNQHASWCREMWRKRERSFAELPDVDPWWDPPRKPDRELWLLVVGLPDRQRSAIVLRYYQGLSVAEAATVLRCSLGTVRSNTSRGLAALRDRAARADLDVAG